MTRLSRQRPGAKTKSDVLGYDDATGSDKQRQVISVASFADKI